MFVTRIVSLVCPFAPVLCPAVAPESRLGRHFAADAALRDHSSRLADRLRAGADAVEATTVSPGEEKITKPAKNEGNLWNTFHSRLPPT